MPFDGMIAMHLLIVNTTIGWGALALIVNCFPVLSLTVLGCEHWCQSAHGEEDWLCNMGVILCFCICTGSNFN